MVRDRSGAGDQDVGSALVGDRATADTLVDNHVSVGALVEDEAAAGGLVAFVAGRDPRADWSTAWGAWRCLRRPSMCRAAPPADPSAGLSARSSMPRGGRRARRSPSSGAYGGLSTARARGGLGRAAPSSSSHGSDEMHSQHKSGSREAAASIATTATAVAFAVSSDMRALASTLSRICDLFLAVNSGRDGASQRTGI